MKRFVMRSKHWGAVIVTVDEEDAYLLREFVWTVSGSSTPVVARRVDGKMVQLSHLISGAKPGEWVRHANGIQLDCRKENLLIEIKLRKATC